MIRWALICCVFFSVVFLKGGFKLDGNSDRRGSISDQVQISSELKPEIVAAFEAISLATDKHNRVFLAKISGTGPVNGPAFTAGIEHLDGSARKLGGLAKQIIDAVNTTRVYEKGLFVPFDTMRAQVAGMESWGGNQAVQTRGYIHIIDQEIQTYDVAVAYLERGEEQLLQQNFDRYRVPQEVTKEFLRLHRIWGKELGEYNLGMFSEQRSSLQCNREALSAPNEAVAKERMAEAKRHQRNAADFKAKMIAALRKQIGS